MERGKQITFGLLALCALLLVVNLFTTGGIKGLFSGNSEDGKIRGAAASMLNSGQEGNVAPASSGNIPGTNVNANPTPSGPTTTLQYENDKFEFGVVDEGEIVKHVFKFKNTGSEPLVISNAKGSCGCTVPTWPKEPIPPGGTSEIKVEFNTKGKPGPQSKKVTVTANTVPAETFIEVSGEVRGKEQPAAKGGTRPTSTGNGSIQKVN